MFTKRGTWALLTLVPLMAVSVVLAVGIYSPWLPDPETADREGIVRWLVLRDLSQESDQTRSTLARRIEQLLSDEESDLTTGLDELERLTPDQLAQMRRNAELLKELWFFEKVEGYFALPETDRGSYLDRSMRTAVYWTAVDLRLDGSATGDATALAVPVSPALERTSVLAQLLARVERWLASAQGERRERVRDVLHAALVRWLASYDLSQESTALRRSLVEKIEPELGAVSLSDTVAMLAGSDDDAFSRNVVLLAETWFLERGRNFARLESSQRQAFVDRHVRTVTGLIDQQGAEVRVARLGTSLLSNIETWIERADPGEREDLRLFAQHLQSGVARYKVEQLRKLFGF